MYGDCTVAAQPASSLKAVRPLEGLSNAVARVERVNDQLDGFINRFRASSGANPSPPEPGCYEAVINRLFDAIETLELRANAITSIG